MCSLLKKPLFLAVLWACLCGPGQLLLADWQVSPHQIELRHPESSQQVVVGTKSSDERSLDLTRLVEFSFTNPEVASIDDRGLVKPLSDGETELRIRHDGQEQLLPVVVTAWQQIDSPSFYHDIIPVLSKAGCNSGRCHGKAEGQRGFKLSIFATDPEADYQAIARDGIGRRVWAIAPEQSLVLLKGAAKIPHGGGKLFAPDSELWQKLRRWIASGTPLDETTESPSPREIVRLILEPQQVILDGGGSQQLQLTAIDRAGERHCVTTMGTYESNMESMARVDGRGLIESSDMHGEAVILARYMNNVTVCRVTLPQVGVTVERAPEHNFIDGHVWDKLERLGFQSSALADDATFLRRVFLDTIGTLPTTEEARRFLTDPSADKRSHLIDRLLERNEYAEYWAMKWLDLLRADQRKIGAQATVALQRWLRRQFRENRPFDQIAYGLVTAQGNPQMEGPVSFYSTLEKPEIAAREISQLLLGVRIECAQCHHHPSEKWSLADYWALAGFFTGVKNKTVPGFGNVLLSRGGKDLEHPRTGETLPARALGAEPVALSDQEDRRRVLADWMISHDNPFLAKTIANRLWSHYLGRGLVEPIDDMRETNPATNEPLLEALTQHMLDVGFDLKAFTRTLLQSRTYQLSPTTNASNASDMQNFSHALQKTISAEVLLDAICQATGVPEEFNGWPVGYRAIQIWDNRMPSYFFRVFGRPIRATVCECERSDQPSMSQALHLLNAPEITQKITHRHGRARRLAEQIESSDKILEELYLCTLSRLPNQKERDLMSAAFSHHQSDHRAAAEDILWALLNSKEFTVNH